MKFTFMYAWLSGWCTVCLFCLYQPFMYIWVGEKLLFPMLDVVLICIYFYSLTMGDVRSQYSAAIGLFWENRVYVLVEAIANIVLNYFLGKKFGVHGIIIATWLSIFFINFGWGSSIIFKYYFVEYNKIEYYAKQMLYFLNTIIATVLTYVITYHINGNIYVKLIGSAIVCMIVPNIYFLIVYYRTNIAKESYDFIKTNILVRLKRNKGV